MAHKKGIRLSVPEPCQEKWSDMNPSERGRYCASCDKVVVDFTGFTDEQILNHFLETSGKQCGRFHPVQLDKKIVPVRNVERASAMSLFFSSLLVLWGFREANGQEIPKSEPTVQTTTETNLTPVKPRFAELPNPYKIEGLVIDSSSGELLIGASLVLEGTGAGCSTDLDGRFSFTIPNKYVTDGTRIKVQSIGYEPKYYALTEGVPKKIGLKPDYNSVILGGATMTVGVIEAEPFNDRMERLRVKTWLKSIGHW